MMLIWVDWLYVAFYLESEFEFLEGSVWTFQEAGDLSIYYLINCSTTTQSWGGGCSYSLCGYSKLMLRLLFQFCIVPVIKNLLQSFSLISIVLETWALLLNTRVKRVMTYTDRPVLETPWQHTMYKACHNNLQMLYFMFKLHIVKD